MARGSSIDERIVELKLDNKGFESGVKQSLGTIEELKNGLLGLDRMNGVGFAAIQNGIDGLKERFSLLSIAAISALNNIVSRAVDAGVQIAKALTIQPVTDGFREYELKMGSTQTIMASTGRTLEDVNEALRQLNEYSDQTIYRFSDMTANIGKFTNAGVGLEDSVNAIKGISSAAALSGANTNDAARAMYNLGQAMSQGFVRLMDWKSIENANMATVEFKNELIDTAVSVGTLTKGTDGLYQSVDSTGKAYGDAFNATSRFNDSLKDEWLTTDVLVQTLGDYADATTDIGAKALAAATEIKTFTQMMDNLKESIGSGWAQSFELLFGDFEEARNLWTNMGDRLEELFAKPAEARNKMLKEWHDDGGYASLFNTIFYAFDALSAAIEPIKEGIANVFPAITSENLIKMTQNLESFTKGLILNEDAQAAVESVTTGLASAFDVVSMAAKAVWDIFVGLVGVLDPLWALIGRGIVALADWVTAIRNTIAETDLFGRVADKVVSFFQGMWDAIEGVFSGDISVSELFQGIWQSILNGWNWLKESLLGIGADDGQGGIFRVIGDRLTESWEWMKSLFSKIRLGDELQPIWESIVKAFKDAHRFLFGSGEDGPIGIFTRIGEALLETWEWLKGVVSSIDFGAAWKTIWDSVSSAFEWLGNKYQEWDIGGKLRDIWGKIVSVFDWIKSTISDFSSGDFDFKKFVTDNIPFLSDDPIDVSSAVAERTSKVFEKVKEVFENIKTTFLSMIESFNFNFGAGVDKITGFFGTIGDLFGPAVKGVFKAVADFLSDASLQDLVKLAQTGTSIAIAVKIPALLGSVRGLFNSFSDALGGFSGFTGREDTFATKMVKMSLALAGLVVAVSALGGMDTQKAIKGLTAAGTLILLLSGMGKILDGAELKGVGTNLLLLSATVAVLAQVAKSLGTFNPDQLLQGIIALGVIMLELAATVKIMQGANLSFGNGAALLLLAAAVKMLAGIVDDLGEMDTATALKGTIAIGALMLELAAASRIIGSTGAKLTQGLGAMGLAGAVLMLSTIVDDLGKLDTGTAIQGVLSVGVLLAELAAASALIGSTNLKLRQGLSAAALAGAIVMLTSVVDDLGEMDTSTAMQGVIMLGVIMAELTLVGVALNGVKISMSTVVSLGLVLLEITVALGYISDFDGDGLLEKVTSISLVLGSCAILMRTLSGIPISGALTAAGNLGIALASISAAVAIAGGIYQIPGVDKILADGGKFLGLIGTAIGEFVGGIIGGIGAGISNSFATIGTNLTDFMTNAEGFFSGISKLDDKVSTGAGILTSVMLQITGATFLEGISNILTLGFSSVNTFGSKLKSLGEGIQEFATAVKDVDADDVTSAANAAQVLITATEAISNEGGIGGLIGGSQAAGLTEFINNLKPLGTAIKDYAKEVSGIDDSAVTSSANALTILVDAASSIGAEGGIVDVFTGSSAEGVSAFAGNLPTLGESLKKYAAHVEGITEGSVEGSARAITILSEAASTLGSEGGIFQAITGDNSTAVNSFAENLPVLGGGLKSYAALVKGITAADVEGSANAIAAVQAVIDGIGVDGGLAGFIQSIFGGSTKQGIMDFTDNMVELGSGIKEYADSVKDISQADINASANAISVIQAIIDGFGEDQGLWTKISEFFNGSNSAAISQFATDAKALGDAISDYASSVSGVTKTNIDSSSSAISVLVNLVTALESVDTKPLKDFGQAYKDFSEDLKDVGTNLASVDSTIIDSINTEVGDMITLIKDMASAGDYTQVGHFTSAITTLGTNLKGFYDTVKEISPTALNPILEAIRSLVTLISEIVQIDASSLGGFAESLRSAGDLGVKNFISAFTEGVPAATQAGFELANGAVQGLMSIINQFMSVATMSAVLYQQGLSMGRPQAHSEGEGLAMSAVRGLVNVLNAFMETANQAVQMWVTGLMNGQGSSGSAGQALANAAYQGLQSYNNMYRSAGYNAGVGFVNGILEMQDAAYNAGQALANAARAGMESALEIESPSKVTWQDGIYVGEGFIFGMASMTRPIMDEAARLGDVALESIKEAMVNVAMGFEEDINMQPIIQPVVDTSQVTMGTKAINEMLNPKIGYRAGKNFGLLEENAGMVNTAMGTPNERMTVQFVQNNNSPKALSRLDIYRQTRTQIAQIGRVIEGAV